jgi:hypothetical protein
MAAASADEYKSSWGFLFAKTNEPLATVCHIHSNCGTQAKTCWDRPTVSLELRSPATPINLQCSLELGVTVHQQSTEYKTCKHRFQLESHNHIHHPKKNSPHSLL